MGGLQLMVPARFLSEARDVLRARMTDAAEDVDEEGYEPGRRRDRWKAWILLIWILGPIAALLVIGLATRLIAIVHGLIG
jgi:uncharacterized membrane protein YphA (DoxX/SURF4 family)